MNLIQYLVFLILFLNCKEAKDSNLLQLSSIFIFYPQMIIFTFVLNYTINVLKTMRIITTIEHSVFLQFLLAVFMSLNDKKLSVLGKHEIPHVGISMVTGEKSLKGHCYTTITLLSASPTSWHGCSFFVSKV